MPPAQTPIVSSDESLPADLCEGSEEALRQFVQLHGDNVYNFTFRRLANWADAEDITSEVFLQLWRQRRDLYTTAGSIRPWLIGVARNLVKARYTSRSRETTGPVPAQTQADTSPETVIQQAAMKEIIDALDQLPERLREVTSLRVWDELTYEEISFLLDIPIGTVRSRLSRSRSFLRSMGVNNYEQE